MSLTRERIAFRLIGTPLQWPLEKLRWLRDVGVRRRHPEQRDFFREGQRIRQWMRQTITPTDNCADIGSHLGAMLHEMMTLAPHGRHFAVEPIAYKAELLRRRYRKAQIHQMALAESVGEVEFFQHTRWSGLSGLRPIQADADVQRIIVPCRRLDDIVTEDRPLKFVKLDVEGAELLAFRGARRTLTRMKPVALFECCLFLIKNFGITPREIFDFFNDEVGYEIYRIGDRLTGGPPLDYDGFVAAMTPPIQALNFIAAPINCPDKA